jgi:hypothetical protein
MRARIFLAMLIACAVCVTAAAETIVVGGRLEIAPTTVPHPHRGQTMQQVERAFGTPLGRSAPIGHPPMTWWDYRNFTVYFEYTRVVHAVVHPPAARTRARHSSAATAGR